MQRKSLFYSYWILNLSLLLTFRGDLGIPNDVDSFSSLLRKCLVLEFLIVTVVKPVMALEANTAAKLRRWHKVRDGTGWPRRFSTARYC